ncbi:MAG: hypothetical protein AB9856_11155 [Cellulosilyticaceae bacterium]
MKKIQINKILIMGIILIFIFCIGHLRYGQKDKMEELILAETAHSVQTLSEYKHIKKNHKQAEVVAPIKKNIFMKDACMQSVVELEIR